MPLELDFLEKSNYAHTFMENAKLMFAEIESEYVEEDRFTDRQVPLWARGLVTRDSHRARPSRPKPDLTDLETPSGMQCFLVEELRVGWWPKSLRAESFEDRMQVIANLREGVPEHLPVALAFADVHAIPPEVVQEFADHMVVLARRPGGIVRADRNELLDARQRAWEFANDQLRRRRHRIDQIAERSR